MLFSNDASATPGVGENCDSVSGRADVCMLCERSAAPTSRGVRVSLRLEPHQGRSAVVFEVRSPRDSRSAAARSGRPASYRGDEGPFLRMGGGVLRITRDRLATLASLHSKRRSSESGAIDGSEWITDVGCVVFRSGIAASRV